MTGVKSNRTLSLQARSPWTRTRLLIGMVIAVGVLVVLAGVTTLWFVSTRGGLSAAWRNVTNAVDPGVIDETFVAPTRPLEEWIQGKWQSVGPAEPYKKSAAPTPLVATQEFRANGTWERRIGNVKDPEKIVLTGTWTVKETYGDLILVHMAPKPGSVPQGVGYRMRIEYVNENVFRFVDDITQEETVAARYRRVR